MRHDEHRTLRRLAHLAGVVDRYTAGGAARRPPVATLRAVLEALGHPCSDESVAAGSVRALRRRPWTEPVAPVVVHWQDDAEPPAVPISVADTRRLTVRLTLEEGTSCAVASPVWGGVATIDGRERTRGTVRLPRGLPIGYHRLDVLDGDDAGRCTVVVAPASCPDPGAARRWGWMVQTYAMRSRDSWGQGEFRDLAALAEWSADRGADFVLTNPVHAAAPTVPRQPSPYSPTSRRFVDPSYLHVPDMPEYAALPDDARDALRVQSDALGPDSERIDRDVIWRVKRAAFAQLFASMSDERQAALHRYRAAQGPSLEHFAIFCALAEVHGLPWTQWPEELRHPDAPGIARWAREHADRVGLHAWLQLACREQLDRAQQRARDAGMAVGIVHDLAVGVDADGADAWALPDEVLRGFSVGAPPDAFNEQGQNWAQPPLHPDEIRRSGYRTLRELLGTSLAVGGGLRIDHILGLSRLFWIPDGTAAADGAYVRYHAEEQFAVLVLEAHRADALVVGEDLGTVDARIRTLMRRRGVAGSAVLYFERDGDGRRRAGDYPGGALASVTTHDLPTATGWWDGSAIDVRVDLGLVDEPEDSRTEHAREQASMRALLRDHGCLGDATPTVRDLVLAMHRFLAMTPSALVAAAVWDALGDPRQPNMPGTVDAYPNWLLPLARPDAAGPRPVALEQLYEDAAVAELVTVLAEQRPG